MEPYEQVDLAQVQSNDSNYSSIPSLINHRAYSATLMSLWPSQEVLSLSRSQSHPSISRGLQVISLSCCSCFSCCRFPRPQPPPVLPYLARVRRAGDAQHAPTHGNRSLQASRGVRTDANGQLPLRSGTQASSQQETPRPDLPAQTKATRQTTRHKRPQRRHQNSEPKVNACGTPPPEARRS